MRKFFSFRSSNSSGNDSIAPSELSKGRKKLNLGVTEAINSKISAQQKFPGVFLTPEDNVLKPLNENLEDETSNPYLRRSLSFTSAATCNHSNERCFTPSSDQSRMTACRDNDQRVGRYRLRHDLLTPDRYSGDERENLQLYGIEKPNSSCTSGVQQNSSDSNSVCSSPVIPLRCRATRSSQISSQNAVLDLYIDGEHEASKEKKIPKKCASENDEDCKIAEKNKISIIGKPPRGLCTVPTSPHFSTENHRSYSFREFRDKHFDLSGREWTSNDLKPAFQPKYLENNIDRTCAFHGKSIFNDSQTNASTEDIYQHLSDGNQTMNSDDAAQGCFYVPFGFQRKDCFSWRGSKATENDELVNTKHQEHDTNENLLNKLKDLEERYCLLLEEGAEPEKIHHGSLSESSLLQNVRIIKEDQRYLAAELSLQIRSRLAERSLAIEHFEQSKLELSARTRRLEKEKNELQMSLESELDRRNSDWSLKLSKIQAEEQRLRERVRELAEHNVSLQKEISSLQGSELESRTCTLNIERQLNESKASQGELKAENFNLRQALMELQERCSSAEEQRGHIKSSLKEMEKENMELHKLICRLQRSYSEQDKTICSLRQTLEKKILEGDSDVVELQTEKIRLTGVEQKLRRELEACRIETESLRIENIQLLNRIKGNENRCGLSLLRLNVELHAWVECLKMQGLSLLDDSNRFCSHLLDCIACKRSENCENANSDYVKYSSVDLIFKYQNLSREIMNFRRSLKIASTALEDKSSIQASGCMCQSLFTNTDSSKHHQNSHDGSDVDMEVELKAEAIITRLLREKICSRELEFEQLHGDLASSIRNCDLLRADIQRLNDEVSSLYLKKKDMEIQMLKRDEDLSLLQKNLQECTGHLAVARGSLKNTAEERDHIWEEMKRSRESSALMDCELKSLHKKIELLEEDLLYKEGQISILKDSIGNKAFDMICSPESLKQFHIQ